MSGFLDDIPDLGMGETPQRRIKPAEKPVAPHVIVRWQPVKCPHCRSKRCPVTHTEAPIRYHKCLDCDTNFKSVEES